MPTLQKLGEVGAGTQYLAYPAVYQRDMIPADAFNLLHTLWSDGRKVIPNAEFFLARGVYLVHEGLVFDADAELIAQTRLDFTDAEVAQARALLIQALQNASPIVRHPRAVLCKKRGGHNYGHWLVEMLPKAYWVLRKLKARGWPMAVQACGPEMRAVIRDSLALLGISPEQIIETDDNPVFFEELVLVSGLSEHASFISPLVMDCMAFIADKAPTGAPSSLYAVRRPSRFRDFEVEPAAREAFLRYGYKEIECGRLPFLAQVSAFKSARRVTGPVGASLANAIFCDPGAELLVFMPASALELFYWRIAEAKRLVYDEVRTEETGPVTGNLPWDRALRISQEALGNLLQRLDARRRQPSLPLI